MRAGPVRKGQGFHGRASKLYPGKRYLLVTASNFAVPVQVIGSIPNGTGRYILIKTTR